LGWHFSPRVVGIAVEVDRFDEATGDDTDEGNFLDEAGGIGGFDASEVGALEATRVEPMF
jgi:hypothetical protein